MDKTDEKLKGNSEIEVPKINFAILKCYVFF